MNKDDLKFYGLSFLVTAFLGVIVVLLTEFLGIRESIPDLVWVAFGGFLFCFVGYVIIWRFL